MNKICLIGRLTASPELRYTSNGTPVCNFRIACERNYTNRDGDREVDFINIVTWRGLAENCARHLGKGRLVGIDGSLQIRKSKKDNRTYINPEVKADNVRFLDFANNNNQEKQPSVSDQHKERVEKTLKREEQDQEFDDNFNADDFDVPF